MKNGQAFLRKAVEESLNLKKDFFQATADNVIAFYELLRTVREQNRQVLIFGNGGSAADAQHFAAEMMHRVESKEIGIRAIALHTDTSLITALGNDEGFQQIFARQIEVLARPGDLAVAISTSGSSTNIVEALRSARKKECKTVGLLGRNGGKARELCDLALIVPGDSTPRIQEVHGMIIHIVCQLLEQDSGL